VLNVVVRDVRVGRARPLQGRVALEPARPDDRRQIFHVGDVVDGGRRGCHEASSPPLTPPLSSRLPAPIGPRGGRHLAATIGGKARPCQAFPASPPWSLSLAASLADRL